MSAAIATLCESLALSCDDGQQLALQRYLELLQRWNSTYNLTAVRGAAGMLSQHLADCLAILQPLARDLRSGRLLDVGSGGGLPGVVIAVMRPDLSVTCVDAVGKKAAFVRQAAGLLGLRNLTARHGRVEALAEPQFDAVVSRAFASLPDFVAWTEHLLLPQGFWMAMKGQVPHDEIKALPESVEMFHVEPLAVPGLDAQRCLVWMRRRQRPGPELG